VSEVWGYVAAYALVVVAIGVVLVVQETRDFAAKQLTNAEERARDAWNAHAYGVWESTGWYPQELETGVVRWYRTGHGNPVEYGRTTAG